jgi:hypothetical protein
MTPSNPNLLGKPAGVTGVGCSDLLARMVELADIWIKRARRKFRDAEGERDMAGKKLIEHGATCYFNCSEELRKLADELATSHTQPKSRVRKKLPA